MSVGFVFANLCLVFASYVLLKFMSQASCVGEQVGFSSIYILQSNFKHRSFCVHIDTARGYFFVPL
jgi:hypothetical protein